MGAIPLISKIFKLSILLLWYQFIFIPLKLANEGHNYQFIWSFSYNSPPTTSKEMGGIYIPLSST